MEVLISADDIQRRVREIAAEIGRDHPGGVHLIAVLKGSLVAGYDFVHGIEGVASEFSDLDAFSFLVGLYESRGLRFEALEGWLRQYAVRSSPML